MAEAGIRVEGAASLRRTLRRAGEDLQDLKEAHAAAGAIAGGRARDTAPRGPSGRLAASVRWSGAAASATIRAGSAGVPYALPIHWGWPRRGIPAQPFISTAAQATEPAWTAVYEAAVERILGRVKGI